MDIIYSLVGAVSSQGSISAGELEAQMVAMESSVRQARSTDW